VPNLLPAPPGVWQWQAASGAAKAGEWQADGSRGSWPGRRAYPFWFEHQDAAFIVGVILVTATTTAGLVGLTVRRQQRQQHP